MSSLRDSSVSVSLSYALEGFRRAAIPGAELSLLGAAVGSARPWTRVPGVRQTGAGPVRRPAPSLRAERRVPAAIPGRGPSTDPSAGDGGWAPGHCFGEHGWSGDRGRQHARHVVPIATRTQSPSGSGTCTTTPRGGRRGGAGPAPRRSAALGRLRANDRRCGQRVLVCSRLIAEDVLYRSIGVPPQGPCPRCREPGGKVRACAPPSRLPQS